jgi:hypothetical protein
MYKHPLAKLNTKIVIIRLKILQRLQMIRIKKHSLCAVRDTRDANLSLEFVVLDPVRGLLQQWPVVLQVLGYNRQLWSLACVIKHLAVCYSAVRKTCTIFVSCRLAVTVTESIRVMNDYVFSGGEPLIYFEKTRMKVLRFWLYRNALLRLALSRNQKQTRQETTETKVNAV